ncbi:MAG TPA: carboxypeptidase-like regulatory domain-containing protein [Bryobacteraceae bacterium]|nr:carboxypeptidase-like regulatory domain-containing protein [Bryobacteraceae bacterium]
MNGSRIAGAILFCALAFGQKNASYSIIEGAVFRDPGLALADAKVVLQAKDNPKAKKRETTTNFRGEFEFRVPAVEAVYVLKATMKGFRADQKEAQVAGGGVPGSERVEVNLVLSPESK